MPDIETYQRDHCAVFHRTKDRFGPFANMHGGFPLRVNGVVYQSSEALWAAR